MVHCFFYPDGVGRFGDGMAGQLGHNDQGLCVTAVSPVGLAGIPIARIAAGDAHSVLVTHNGSVMVCGHGYSLGRGVANDNAATMPPAVWSSKLGALLNGHVTPKAGEVERGDVCQLAPLAVPVESKFRALKLAGTLASSVSKIRRGTLRRQLLLAVAAPQNWVRRRQAAAPASAGDSETEVPPAELEVLLIRHGR